ncbi:hypothetical protein FA95DRAFT_1503283 [Auriscalpium vulgare]|uniref:Uncharacterized protein n=1 Tax=Auriscalpium vulgare TaxID=40419 RepID=A0ACB8R7J6_9AGAM|nr:hypothetical protein FA95DRAFT_1503283 [Auriscalpium vulgare]
MQLGYLQRAQAAIDLQQQQQAQAAANLWQQQQHAQAADLRQQASLFDDDGEPYPITVFFTHIPGFHHDSEKSPSVEFDRLKHEKRWPNGSRALKEAHRAYADALTMQFNRMYGTDVNDIRAWQRLCRVVGIEPPASLEAAREAILTVHVNLVDLVNFGTYHRRETVEIFPSELALSEYSKREDKIFPRDEAKAGGILRYLLRHINNPPAEHMDHGRG